MPTYIHRPPELGGTTIVNDYEKGGPLKIGEGDNPFNSTRGTYALLYPIGFFNSSVPKPGHVIKADGHTDQEVSPKSPHVTISQTLFEYKSE